MRAPTMIGPLRRHPRLRPAMGLLALALLGPTACGAAPGDGEEEGVPTIEATPELAAIDPWARAAPGPEPSTGPDAAPANSAAYLVLRNGTDRDDALVAVETTVADTAELHTVTMDGGIMRMRPVDAVPLPAGGEAVLAPGGYHIMLVGLGRALAEGDTAMLDLRFRSGRTLRVAAPVLRAPPR